VKLVRGELTTLKSALSIAKTKVVHPETKYHYEDAIKKFDLILNKIM
jgi:hypothetical protein